MLCHSGNRVTGKPGQGELEIEANVIDVIFLSLLTIFLMYLLRWPSHSLFLEKL